MLAMIVGCRTAPKRAPVDLSGPGWQVRQGQALWRSKRDAPEIAGEIVLATNVDGRGFVQFLKNPLPLLTAQVGPAGWQVEFVPEARLIAGRGKPPSQLIWLQMLRALQGLTPSQDFVFGKEAERTVIENRWTGEKVTLFLNEG